MHRKAAMPYILRDLLLTAASGLSLEGLLYAVAS